MHIIWSTQTVHHDSQYSPDPDSEPDSSDEAGKSLIMSKTNIMFSLLREVDLAVISMACPICRFSVWRKVLHPPALKEMRLSRSVLYVTVVTPPTAPTRNPSMPSSGSSR